MKRWIACIAIVVLWTSGASAHFVWIVPDGPADAAAKVIFSDSLEPDENVPIERIVGTKLHARDSAGKTTPLDWKKGDHALLVTLGSPGPSQVGGVCVYGVSQRGGAKPTLIHYYPKWIRGEIKESTAWDALLFEIVPRGAGKFVVFFQGKPAADAEVVVYPPAPGKKATLKTDAQGEFSYSDSTAGLHAIRARHTEAKAGEANGKKYEETRHHATLIYRAGAVKKTEAEFAPLPRAVSSFGAAVADGWVYVFGGHVARTHSYSTEAVTGAFHRLNLANPKAWEELPAGPPCQGVALLAHGGKIYRIGGMQPRNKPGERADNHSLASSAVFDPSTRKWTALPDLPAGRSSHDAIAVGDRIVVVGGWHMHGAGKPSEWHDTALMLDLKQSPLRWESIPQPFERRALTVAELDGKVWVLGGMASTNEIERTVNVFDPAKKTWTAGPELPGKDRNGFSPAACTAGGKLFVSTGDGKVHRLSSDGKSWHEIGQLQQARIVHRMVPAGNDLLLALGGAARGTGATGNVALTEAFRVERSASAVGPITLTAARAEPAGKKPPENPAATRLLAEARAARYEWAGFPGFTADVEINVDGQVHKGKASVDARGKVTLELPDAEVATWARRTLGSIVGHRLPGATELQTPCAFADDNAHHPLGRAIRVLNDEFHSSYRIRDRQVIVVNREMKDLRFTITVIENVETPNKQFLPAHYVVNYWNRESNALARSESHHQTWQRVGGYELPWTASVVTAAPAGKLEARKLTLSKVALTAAAR